MKDVVININELSRVYVECIHELSGIKVQIIKPREKAAILDMRAEALNEIEFLVKNSPRYARILNEAKETNNE